MKVVMHVTMRILCTGQYLVDYTWLATLVSYTGKPPGHQWSRHCHWAIN